MYPMHLGCYETKQPNLKLKTRPQYLLGCLPLDISILGYMIDLSNVERKIALALLELNPKQF
jgi:hypothetical protein